MKRSDVNSPNLTVLQTSLVNIRTTQADNLQRILHPSQTQNVIQNSP